MKYFKIVLLLFLLFNIKNIQAQLPLNDATFNLVYQDNFNSFNSTDWYNQYSWKGPINNGLEYNSPANLNYTLNTGYLTIKCETVTPITYTPGAYSPYPYQSGVIQSKFAHKYGYFEISAKLPTGSQGYWPAFWLLGGPNSCTTQGYNEIDILENNGLESIPGTIMGWHYLWMYIPLCTTTVNWWDPDVTGLATMSNEHKYAVFWEPNKMTWFFDDVPVATVIDYTNTPQNACCTIINFALDPTPNQTPNGSTIFPAYFQINYLKIWQLIPDCLNSSSFCNSFNATTWNGGGTNGSKVKQYISIGGSGCSDNINTSDNIHFWATDYILINEGTTISDNGSGAFTASTTDCPN
jgi:beta-glucanase (GH16 family)